VSLADVLWGGLAILVALGLTLAGDALRNWWDG
jgi:hypothetical protein